MHPVGMRTLARFVCFFELTWMLFKQGSNSLLIPKYSGYKSMPGIRIFFLRWSSGWEAYVFLRAGSISLIVLLGQKGRECFPRRRSRKKRHCREGMLSIEDGVRRRGTAGRNCFSSGATCLNSRQILWFPPNLLFLSGALRRNCEPCFVEPHMHTSVLYVRPWRCGGCAKSC